MLSIPYVLNSEESSFRGGADSGRGSDGESDSGGFWGIMSGISGLAGDTATTLNSLTKMYGSDGSPVQVPTIKPPKPEQPNYMLYGGIALVALALVWMLKRK